MMSDPVDVLIAGAGPTGLVLAIQLAEAGVPLRIVDMQAVRSDKSRALVVHARSMEILSRMGLADSLIDVGTKTVHGNIAVRGRDKASLEFSDIGIDETRYPFILFVSQAETERVLETRLNALGVEVERPVALREFVQGDDGVTALLERDGGEERVSVRYLVGADGAHSTVRKCCGMSFSGEPYANDFLLADVDVDWKRGYDRFHLFLGWDGIFAFFPLPGERAYRLISTRGGKESQGQEPTLEEFERRIREHCGIDARLSHPRWIALFRLHHRGVDRYRQGRVFVAGDAAHIHSPAGGQGMNTGMQDAWNLGWKLAWVLKHRADASILDSYHQERFPVGQKLLRFTDRLFSAAISRNWLIAFLRSYLVPSVARIATRSRARRARIFRFVSQIEIRYRRSTLNREIGKFKAGPAPGDRVPDLPLGRPDGASTSVHEQLSNRKFCLLVFAGREVAASALSQLFEVAKRYGWVDTRIVVRDAAEERPLDRDGAVHRRFGIVESGLYLVRPDDHVAFRSQGIDPAALDRYLNALTMPGLAGSAC